MRKHSVEYISNEISKLGYTLIGDYSGVNNKLDLVDSDGYLYQCSWGNLKNGKRKPDRFTSKNKFTIINIKRYIRLNDMPFQLISRRYELSRQPLIWKCLRCEKWFSMDWNHIHGGRGCSKCRMSKGERRIDNFLSKNKIKRVSQKGFDGLLGCRGGKLMFDFYLPNHNTLIEYQGNFHDGSRGEFTRINLEEIREHDDKKRLFAEKNGFNLIVIWYWDRDNIEKILEESLNG